MTDFIEYEMKPCPFCGGKPEYKMIEYTGTMASGMEAPDITIGCPRCDYWFHQLPTEKWVQGEGHIDVGSESRKELVGLWENRA